MTEAIAISEDGTPIAFVVQGGEGPAVVLVHGAMQTAASFDRFAAALARTHRVVRYDRRGRGRNAAGGSDGSPDRLRRETADLCAVAAASGAKDVFGLSSGAILTMSAALATSAIERVVLYEPPFAIGEVDPADWSDQFLAALERRRFGTAMALLVKGTGDREPITRAPRWLLSLLFGVAVRGKAPAPNGVGLRELLSTVPADIAIQREGSRSLPPFSRLAAPTLLLGGTESHPKLTRVLDLVARELPHAERGTIAGSGHIAADDQGKPEEVALAVAAFLSRRTGSDPTTS